MVRRREDHPVDNEAERKHPLQFWNGMSTGNVLTILGGLGTIGVWVYLFGGFVATVEASGATQDQKLEQLRLDMYRLEARSMRETDALRGEVRIVSENVNRLLIANGIKPKEAP